MLQLIKDWPDTPDSTSNADCYFLYETCLEYKPKKILEIGTLVGKSTYAMALGSDCEIHTVDKNRDRFIVHEGFEWHGTAPIASSVERGEAGDARMRRARYARSGGDGVPVVNVPLGPGTSRIG